MSLSDRALPIVGTCVSLVVFFGAWQLYVSVSGVSPLILPAPSVVLHALGTALGERDTYAQASVTLGETVGGFLIALVVGGAAGILFGKVAWLERALQPILVAIQVVPKIALVPLFIVWFGFGMGSKVVIAAVLAFLPIMSNTVLGVKSIEPGHREVMQTLRAGRAARLAWLDLPSAMPYLLTGMEVGIILAMIGAVVGEFLAGTEGLGHMAVAALNGFEVDVLFAIIIILAALGAALYGLIGLLRRILIPWHATASTPSL
jgi:NitT/TauT family transport system permease protein